MKNNIDILQIYFPLNLSLSYPPYYRKKLLKHLSVCLDGFNLALPKGTGVATYGRSLAKTLYAANYNVSLLYGLDIPNSKNEILKEVLFFNLLGSEAKAENEKRNCLQKVKKIANFFNWKATNIPLSGRVETRGMDHWLPPHHQLLNLRNLFNRAHFYYKKTGNFAEITLPSTPDIMHWTYPLPIRVKGAINVYTIHDLVPLRLPQTTLDNKTHYYKLIKKIVSDKNPIITVSEASKNEIISFYPDAANNLYNTYQTIDPDLSAFLQNEDLSNIDIEKLFGVSPSSYFIFFGSLEPKKNIGRVIEAFLSSSTNKRLVIVGAMGWKNEQELRFLKRGIENNRILYIDYLPSQMLFALLRNAYALLFPSIAEGFGLPALEAFRCGTPVLTSEEGGLHDVAKGAALIVDPYSVSSITQGINQLGNDSFLHNELKKRGENKFNVFSQEEYKIRILKTHQSIISKFKPI